MAKETKVGLLAGLAFIICFAVILANRGRQDAASYRLPGYAGRVDGGPGGRLAEPLTNEWATTRMVQGESRSPRDAGRVMPGASRSTSTGSRIEDVSSPSAIRPAGYGSNLYGRPHTLVADRNTSMAGSGGGALVGDAQEGSPVPPTTDDSALAGRGEGTSGTVGLMGDAGSGGTGSLPDGRGSEHARGPESASGSVGVDTRNEIDAARMAALEARLAELSRQIAGAPPAGVTVRETARRSTEPAVGATSGDGSADPPRRVQAPPAGGAGVRYKVSSGDTLTRIAAKFYNGSGARIIEAIFQANKERLSSPDEIREGMELLLPVVDGVSPQASEPRAKESVSSPPQHPPRPREAEEPPTNRPSPRPGPARWYQVQPNDRYVSIAREQLGDAGRWKEIYELNKEKFPDPGRIRPGVRIKLPGTRVAESQGRRP